MFHQLRNFLHSPTVVRSNYSEVIPIVSSHVSIN
jgi:hypothetical protein